MRATTSGTSCLVVLFAVAGCAEKDALDPGAIVREEVVNRIGPPSRATSRTVRCACDTDGGLHVRAPQGSRVAVPEDATYDAELATARQSARS